MSDILLRPGDIPPGGATGRRCRLWPAMDALDTPIVDARYWMALCFASVAGCNLGDFVGLYLGWGHVVGLIPLAVVLLFVLGTERLGLIRGEGWYWAAVLLLRTAATNIADMLTHTPFHLDYPWVLAGLEVAQVILVMPVAPRPRTAPADRPPARPVADGWYWLSLLAAGALGTAVGDCTAEQFGLGTDIGTLVLAVPMTLLLVAGARIRWTSTAGYWLTIVAVRAAGTTAGDWIAFGEGGLNLGLPIATALSCAAYVALLAIWRPARRSGVVRAGPLAFHSPNG